MKKDDRLFAPFPIEMDEHPKIIGLSDGAFRAIIEATFYSRRMLTDGFLDERVVLRRWGQEVAEELSSNDRQRPSWIRVEGGWQIHDFEKHHPLRAEIEAKRADLSEKRSQAGRIGAAKRWQRDSKPEASDSSETETETETSLSNERDISLSPDESDDLGTLISADWRPNQKHIDNARSLRVDVKHEYQRFRAHAERTQRRMKNWNAGFTNWLKQGVVMERQQQGAPIRIVSKAEQRQQSNLSVVAQLAAMDEPEQKGIGS